MLEVDHGCAVNLSLDGIQFYFSTWQFSLLLTDGSARLDINVLQLLSWYHQNRSSTGYLQEGTCSSRRATNASSPKNVK